MYTNQDLANFATQYAGGTPVTLSCDQPWTMPSDVQGWVWFNADGSVVRTIHLREGLCALLRHSDQDSYLSNLTSTAMLTFTHEDTHIVTDSEDESYVECTAMQNRWSMVKLFRLPAWIARFIMKYESLADSELEDQYHAEPCNP